MNNIVESSVPSLDQKNSVSIVSKDAVDLFIEEFGEWPLEMVRFNLDDGGRILEIFVEDSCADEMRKACPPRYNDVWTVILGVPKDWGAS